MKDLFLALVHSPVIDRNGEIITASVTNLDLQDIARSCRTFGIKKYFVVHPSPDEQALNRRILSHWYTGHGLKSHPTRSDALHLVSLVSDFSEAITETESIAGMKPLLVGTSARRGARTLSIGDFREKSLERPVILVFGTGYGLSKEWSSRLDFFLEPIEGAANDFNHLSVRSAVAIYLDRIQSRLIDTPRVDKASGLG